MNVVTLTLFRKGSKRFPDKVRQTLNGKPLYLWTVEMAQFLGFPYVVAHDYPEGEIILPEWVNELKRKREYAGDDHKTNEEIKSFNLYADIYILLQVTSPLRDFSGVKCQVNHFLRNTDKYDLGLHVYKMRPGYYYTGGVESNFFAEHRDDNGCSDKLDLFRETGSLYIFKKEMLEKDYIGHTYRKVLYETPYNVDIDTKEDLEKAKEIKNNEN